ncbi:MAG: hypothetical protein IJU47_00905 [Verrucomicrobia bacterium]|nr:hypothetical protein [Verrucomicrobiota bacterium]
MNKINKFKTNWKSNRMTNWASPVTTSLGVAAVTTLIALSPFQTVSAGVPDEGFDTRNRVLNFFLNSDSDGLNANDRTSCFVKVYKAYDSTDKDREYCFTPRMSFVLNPEDSSIIQKTSKDISFDGATFVKASFIVETYNPAWNKLIASRCLMDKVFQMNTNNIRFSPLPVNSVALKVTGSDGKELASMDSTNVLLTDMTEWRFSLDFDQDAYDQFQRDLENNAVQFEFTLSANRVKYDTIDFKVEVMADIVHAFKSILGSKKEFVLDQESWGHLTSFIAMNTVVTGRVTDPAYLSSVGVHEAVAMQFIKLCFDVITDDPNGDYANAEILKISELPTHVDSNQNEQNQVDTSTDKKSYTVVRSKSAKGGGSCLGIGAKGGISETSTNSDAHENSRSNSNSRSRGETEQNVADHSYVRLALRDNSDRARFSTRYHLQLPSEIDKDQVTVKSCPAITHDNVMDWVSDFQSRQVTEYVADFESKRADLLKMYAEFEANNNQIKTLKNQVKSKIDKITSRLETASQGTLYQQMESKLNRLLSDGIWESLNVQDEVPNDGKNIAAWFKKRVRKLNNIKVSLSDEKGGTDYERVIRNLKRFKLAKDPLTTIQDINKQLVLSEDLLDRLKVQLKSQDQTLENLKELNKKLTDFIMSTQ